MGSSFVLFDVSMEMTLGQFRSGKSGYTQKRFCPWANAIYPRVKGLVTTTTQLLTQLFTHITQTLHTYYTTIRRIVFKFLWRDQDRVVRTAMINSYENGGLRVLEFESVRLSWFKRLFASENAGWKCYLTHPLKPFGGLFLLLCDYDPKDYNISNQFYADLIQFWAEFRNAFSDKHNKSSIKWRNKNIRIDRKPVFYKSVFEKKSISLISQIGLSKNNLDSLDAVRQETNIGYNFLEWSGLRSAIPFHEEG